MESKDILRVCLLKGFLIDKEVLNNLSHYSDKDIQKLIDRISKLKRKPKVITIKFLVRKNKEITKYTMEAKHNGI